MKAVIQARYGGPETLELRDVERPVPGPGEVLVRVQASSVNQADWEYLRGMPLVRVAAPLRPRHRIPGSDVAGTVSRLGPGATHVQVGDRVFADLSEEGFGAWAEFVVVRESALTGMPSRLSFEQAAAVPSAAVIALQGLRDRRVIGADDRVLVNGAGGGMGTFAIQLAKSVGAHVTGVDRGDKLDLLRSVGADLVIDYEVEDFSLNGERYDLVLDLAGYRRPFDLRRTLRDGGSYVLVGGSIRRILHAVLFGATLLRGSDVSAGILVGKPNDPALMRSLVESLDAGTLQPIIDRTYPLADAADAMRVIAEGRSRGKIVISIADAEGS